MHAQTNGRLEGLVKDPQGASIPGAKIRVVQNETGRSFETQTNERGEFTIAFLPVATYTVNVTAQGFRSASLSNVKIDAGVPASVNVSLEVGAVSESIVVEGGAEVLQTTSSTVTTTIVGRQVNQLPQMTRNALELVLTQPGTATPGTPRTTSINGLPKGSMNITMDGVNVQDNLLKSDDGFFATIMPKPDAIEEVSISTAGVTADIAGEGAAQVRYVTKSGTNTFRGGLFWQHRNDAFNANYYFNSVDRLNRDVMKLNQFGGSIGGPVKKDKAFFFVNQEYFKLPQTYTSAQATWTMPHVAQGLFRYIDAGGRQQEINIFQIAASRNAALPANVRAFPTTADPIMAGMLSQITDLTSKAGNIRSRIDSNNDYNRFNYTFQTPGDNKRNFPTVKLDYNLTSKHHLDFVWNYQTYYAVPDAVNGVVPILPGTGTILGQDANLGTRRISFSGTGSVRSAWTPAFTTEFRYGVTGGVSLFREEANPGLFSHWRGYALTPGYITNPRNATGSSRRNSPVNTTTVNATWAKGAHLINFGGSHTSVRLWQQNVGTQVIPQLTFALAANDPANFGSTALFTQDTMPGSTPAQRTEAGQMYAMLTGRISQVSRSVALSEESGKYEGIGSVDRNQQREMALYVQDSWRVRPGLTVNAGLRWNVQFPFINQSGIYTTPGPNGAWGVSGPGNLFLPGVMTGQVPAFAPLKAGEGAYRTYWKQFSPSLGFAWVLPEAPGFAKWLTGAAGRSVLRSSYSISTVREGTQTFVSIYGSNQGRTLSLNVTPEGNPSDFGPAGSVWFRDQNLPVRAFQETPSFPLPVLAGQSVNDFDPSLRPGYVQSWTLSFQRELTRDTVLDVRYVGNHGTGLWRQVNLNEVNIFENGFLDQFKIAANNLMIARRTNPNSNNFGNQGLPGQAPIPMIQTGLGTTTDANRAVNLERGEAGAFANAIATTNSNMTRLVNAGYPANLFRVNPTTVNAGSFLMTNLGHSTYNALQLELRRRMSKGLLLQGSYVWSKSLTNMQASSTSVSSQPTTFRNINNDKGISPWDIRHAIKFNWIYELPFGPGRRYFGSVSNPVMNKLIEGWELSAVNRIQSGSPLRLTGRQNFTNTEGGVILHNITQEQLQKMVDIRKTGSGLVYWLPQDIVDNSLAAWESGGRTLAQLDRSKPYIGPQTEPGKLGYRVYLFGPWQNYYDFSLLKRTKITERQSFELRMNVLNAINTPNFLLGAAGNEVNSTAINADFGQTRAAFRDLTVSGSNHPGSRVIEFQLRYLF